MAYTAEEARKEIRRREAIAEIERRKSIQKKESSEEGFAPSIARGARNVAAGVGDVLDTPFALADIASYPIRYGATKLANKALGKNYENPQIGDYTPGFGEKIAGAIDTATNDYTKPKTKTHKITEAVTRGLTSLPTGLGVASTLTKAPKVANALRKMYAPTTTNIVSTGASSGVTQHMLNENPDDVWGALLSGVGTGAAIHGARELPHLSKRFGKGALGLNPQKVEKIERAGIPLTVGDASDYQIAKTAQNWLRKSTVIGNKLTKDFKTTPEIVKEKLGLGKTPQLAGEEISIAGKKALELYGDEISAQVVKWENEALDALHKMPQGKQVPVHQSKQFINDYVANKLEHVPELIEHFASTPTGQVNKKFLTPISSRNKGAIPISPLKEIRTLVGKKGRHHFGLISDQEQGMLNGLYGKLSEDISSHISNTGGKEAKKAWDTRNKIWSSYKKEGKHDLNPFLKAIEGTPTNSPKLIVNNLRRDGKLYGTLEKYLPEDQRPSFTNSIVYNLGEKNGEFNYSKFTKNIKDLPVKSRVRLLEDMAKNTGQKVSDIDNMIDVIDMAKDTLSHANMSNTSHHEYLASLVKNLAYTAGGAGLFGIKSALLPVLTSGIANKHIFANPKLIKKLANTPNVRHGSNPYQRISALTSSTAQVSNHEKRKPLKISIRQGTLIP